MFCSDTIRQVDGLGDFFSDFGGYISRPFERLGEGFSHGQPLKIAEGLILGPAAIALSPIYATTKITSGIFGGLPLVGPVLKTATNVFESPGRTVSNLVRGLPQIVSGAAVGFGTGNVPGAFAGAALAAGGAGADKSKEYRPKFIGSFFKGVGYGIVGGSAANVATGISAAVTNLEEVKITSASGEVSGPTWSDYGRTSVNKIMEKFTEAPIGSFVSRLGISDFVSEHPYLTGGALLVGASAMGSGGAKTPTESTQGQSGIPEGPGQQYSNELLAGGTQTVPNQVAYMPSGYQPFGYGQSLPSPASVPTNVGQQSWLGNLGIPLFAIGLGIMYVIYDNSKSSRRKRRRG